MRARWCELLADPPRKYLLPLGVPERYLRARLYAFPTDILYRSVPSPDGLYLSGGPGVGKTHLATARMVDALASIAIWHPERAEPSVSARWVTVPDLLARFRATFGERARGTEEDVHCEFAGLSLLVLDDLGAEKVTDWTAGAIYRLVCARINALRPTIVTSNLTLTELHEIDPRLASRLAGMTFLRLDGPDRRLGTAGGA